MNPERPDHDVPTLNYLSPESPKKPVTVGQRIVGFLGFALYGLLDLPLLYMIFMAVVDQRRPLGSFDWAIIGSLAGFFTWRAIAGFRQLIT